MSTVEVTPIDVYTELLTRRISTMSEEPLLTVIRFLLTMQNDYRFHMLINVVQVEDLWETIRKNEVITDFVMDLTHELVFGLGFAKHSTLSGDTATALTCCACDGSVIDADLFNRLSSQLTLLDYFNTNPWLLTLALLKFTISLDNWIINHSS